MPANPGRALLAEGSRYPLPKDGCLPFSGEAPARPRWAFPHCAVSPPFPGRGCAPGPFIRQQKKATKTSLPVGKAFVASFSCFAELQGERAAHRRSAREGAVSPLQLPIASEGNLLFHLTCLVNQNPRDFSSKVMPGPSAPALPDGCTAFGEALGHVPSGVRIPLPLSIPPLAGGQGAERRGFIFST